MSVNNVHTRHVDNTPQVDPRYVFAPHSIDGPLRPNPVAMNDMSPMERGRTEAHLEDELGISYGKTRQQRKLLEEDVSAAGEAKRLLKGVPKSVANFLFERDRCEEDQGTRRREKAVATICGLSTVSRKSVVGSFKSLLSATTCTFEDMFAPPSTIEQQHQALIFAVQEGVKINRVGYRDPRSWSEMLRRPEPERTMFIKAATEEVEYGFSNGIYQVKHRNSFDGNVLGNTWVLHMKFDPTTNEAKSARSRLTIRGDQQLEWLDYNKYDLYSPVAKKASLFVVLSIAVQFALFLTKVDITKAFNLGELDREVCMEVPIGFRTGKYAPFGKDTIWQCLVATYGLKQAASAYYRRFAEWMIKKGYKRLGAESCCFVKGELGSNRFIVIPIHVDDKICAYASQADLDMFLADLAEGGFVAKNEGLDDVLGMSASYDRVNGVLDLSLSNMISNCLQEHDLHKCNPKSVPCTPDSVKALQEAQRGYNHFDKERHSKYRSILGVISYIMNNVKPELMFAVSLASQYMSCPSDTALTFVINILLYLKCVQHLPYRLTRTDLSKGDWAVMFCDASLGNRDARRSQTCFLAFLFGNLIACSSRFQPAVALSVAESEFMALSAAGQFACWFVRLINEIGVKKFDACKIFTDSQSAIQIAHNPLCNKYTKHISIRFEWLKQAVQQRVIKPLFMRSASNYSDIGTKALHKKHFLDFMKVLTGHARLNVVHERDCDQFEQRLIDHAGIVGVNVSLKCLSYDDHEGCYYHSQYYMPE